MSIRLFPGIRLVLLVGEPDSPPFQGGVPPVEETLRVATMPGCPSCAPRQEISPSASWSYFCTAAPAFRRDVGLAIEPPQRLLLLRRSPVEQLFFLLLCFSSQIPCQAFRSSPFGVAQSAFLACLGPSTENKFVVPLSLQHPEGPTMPDQRVEGRKTFSTAP